MNDLPLNPGMKSALEQSTLDPIKKMQLIYLLCEDLTDEEQALALKMDDFSMLCQWAFAGIDGKVFFKCSPQRTFKPFDPSLPPISLGHSVGLSVETKQWREYHRWSFLMAQAEKNPLEYAKVTMPWPLKIKHFLKALSFNNAPLLMGTLIISLFYDAALVLTWHAVSSNAHPILYVVSAVVVLYPAWTCWFIKSIWRDFKTHVFKSSGFQQAFWARWATSHPWFPGIDAFTGPRLGPNASALEWAENALKQHDQPEDVSFLERYSESLTLHINEIDASMSPEWIRSWVEKKTFTQQTDRAVDVCSATSPPRKRI